MYIDIFPSGCQPYKVEFDYIYPALKGTAIQPFFSRKASFPGFGREMTLEKSLEDHVIKLRTVFGNQFLSNNKDFDWLLPGQRRERLRYLIGNQKWRYAFCYFFLSNSMCIIHKWTWLIICCKQLFRRVFANNTR